MKKFLILAAASSTLLAACGGAAETSSSTANSNSNANRPVGQQLEPNNRPPGLSGERVTISSAPAGIPASGNANVTANMTPPGDPRIKIVGKDMKPGATPTPGIPDPETIRRQMQSGQNGNANVPPQSGNTSPRPRKKVNMRQPTSPQ